MSKCFSIKDELKGFIDFRLCASNEIAIRDFKNLVKNSPLIKLSPQDYNLYEIGNFDEDTGILVGNGPTLIASGETIYKELNTNV